MLAIVTIAANGLVTLYFICKKNDRLIIFNPKFYFHDVTYNSLRLQEMIFYNILHHDNRLFLLCLQHSQTYLAKGQDIGQTEIIVQK